MSLYSKIGIMLQGMQLLAEKYRAVRKILTNKPKLMQEIIKDEYLYFEFIRVIDKIPEHGADIGEAFHTVKQIKQGSIQETLSSWHDEWKILAERIHKIGDKCLREGHKISARDAYLRATEYYRAAEFFLHSSKNPDDPEILYLLQNWQNCFKKALKLYQARFEIIEIPYEGINLPGYFLPAQNSIKSAPTVILNNGFDGTAEELFVNYGFDLIRRGYNCLIFEGPGQGAVVRTKKLYFRHDWEKVVSQVVDYTLTRNDIDTKAIIFFGLSLGGYLAPRAASFEHRIAACIANEGIFDFFEMQMEAANTTRADMLERITNNPQAVDEFTYGMMEKKINMNWALNHGMWSFGVKSPSEFFRKASEFTLEKCVELIKCPTLIIDTEKQLLGKLLGEGGQAKKLYDALKCPKTMLTFGTDEGADLHCQMGAKLLANQKIFDWLDEIFQ